MDLLISGRNMDVTQRLENYVEKKTGKLDRYMPELTAVNVDLSTESTRSAAERQVAQITIRDSRGTILRAEERSNDMFAAIDAVIDKLYRQIQRYQGKRRRKWRNGSNEAAFAEAIPLEEPFDEEEEGQAIVRQKRFALQPMDAEEAIEQMELVGHDFFVFYNADEASVNVIYRRRDGNYGLLLPELA